MQQKKLKVYFTSDVHGYFYPTTYGDMDVKPVGLFGCAADFNKDDETLIIDGGDILQGSAFAYYCRQVANSPEVIADIMNDCGYDYYTLGNHDFNYGLDYQAAYRNRNNGVCVCQNIMDEEGNTLFPWKLHTMKNGLRIGIAGIVTDYVNIWEKEENLKGIHITDPFEAAKRALAQMKEQTDLTICIYHGGFECDLESGAVLSKTTENVGYRICKELDFDILLTGHQHMSVHGRELFGTYTVQPCDNAKEYQMIETLAKEYQNVELHPLVEREKLLDLYYDMDVVVAPSREDATPATIVEGLMYHKICICSSGTGVSRYLKDGWDGFVFENANADDLRNKLEYMVRNFADLGELRERGRKVYETIYSYDIFEKNVLEKIGNV